MPNYLETNGREWVVNMIDIIFLSTVSVSYNFTFANSKTDGYMNFFTSMQFVLGNWTMATLK